MTSTSTRWCASCMTLHPCRNPNCLQSTSAKNARDTWTHQVRHNIHHLHLKTYHDQTSFWLFPCPQLWAVRRRRATEKLWFLRALSSTRPVCSRSDERAKTRRRTSLWSNKLLSPNRCPRCLNQPWRPDRTILSGSSVRTGLFYRYTSLHHIWHHCTCRQDEVGTLSSVCFAGCETVAGASSEPDHRVSGSHS